jgi:hypothetical protein
MNVVLNDHAQFGYSTFGSDERRELDSWFGHLRCWQTDEHLRSKCGRLDAEEEETYVCDTGKGLLFAFTVAGDNLTIVSIFRKEVLRMFKDPVRASAT